MSVYSTATDWAAEQRPGSPNAKLLLVLLCLDIDLGIAGATHARLARRAEMPLEDSLPAIQLLENLGLIEQVGVDRGNFMYAPRWQA